MTTLKNANLNDLPEQVEKPGYDRADLRVGIVHIGVGGFHRAHEAVYLDDLFATGAGHDWALSGVGVLPPDRTMTQILTAQDGLYTLLVKSGADQVDARVIGSVLGMEHLLDAPDAVMARLADQGVRIVSLTITEGGYPVNPDTREFDSTHPSVAADLGRQSGAPTTVFGLLLAALRARRDAGVAPFTILSCDNVQHNGDVTKASVLETARLADPELADWIEAEVSFPNSMVDRITPSTTDADRELAASRFGIEDGWPVVCEPFMQWVIEDDFSAGRPAWEQVGAQFTSDVAPYEMMKLRLLNAGHQLIGHLGRQLGLTYSFETIEHETLRAFLSKFMTDEAIPTLVQPEGIDLLEYRDSLLERFGNPAVRDSLERLCAFASDRIPKFLLGTIRDNVTNGGQLECSATVLAAWALGSRGVDEQGKAFEVLDPLAASLRAASLREGEVPGAFLDHPVFGGLGTDERLREAYLKALESLQNAGVDATLRAVLGK